MKPSRGPLIAVCCAAAILILPFTGLMPDYWITLFNYIGISSLVAIGLVLLTGVGGMTSFGQAAFVGFGAYTTGVLTVHLGISPWLTLPASLVVTMVAAGLIGAVTVRLSGHYLPLGTIAWGIAFFYLFGNVGWLGAHDGLDGIPPLRIGGHALTDPREYFVVVWIAVVLAVIATQNLLGGRIGRAIRALRRSTRAAEAFGVNTAGRQADGVRLCGDAGWTGGLALCAFPALGFARPVRHQCRHRISVDGGAGWRRPGLRRHSRCGRHHRASRSAAEPAAMADRQHRQFRDGRVRRGSGADPANRLRRNMADPVRPSAAAVTANAGRRPAAAGSATAASGDTAAAGAGGAQGIRRTGRRQRCELRGRQRANHRADRPQRRRQEHDVQPDHRRVSAQLRPNRIRGTSAAGADAATRRDPGPRPHLPACRNRRRHERDRERRARRPSARTRRIAARDPQARPRRRGAAVRQCAAPARSRRARRCRVQAGRYAGARPVAAGRGGARALCSIRCCCFWTSPPPDCASARRRRWHVCCAKSAPRESACCWSSTTWISS